MVERVLDRVLAVLALGRLDADSAPCLASQLARAAHVGASCVVLEVDVGSRLGGLEPPQRLIVGPGRRLLRVEQLPVRPAAVDHHLGLPLALLLRHAPILAALVHRLDPKRTLQRLPVEADERLDLLLGVVLDRKVGLGAVPVQRQTHPVVHLGGLLLRLVVPEVRHFAVHENPSLPLVLAVGRADAHELRRPLPRHEPPARRLLDPLALQRRLDLLPRLPAQVRDGLVLVLEHRKVGLEVGCAAPEQPDGRPVVRSRGRLFRVKVAHGHSALAQRRHFDLHPPLGLLPVVAHAPILRLFVRCLLQLLLR